PAAIAPFEVAVLPMNAKKSQRVREAAEDLYRQLLEAGLDVVLDDRELRPGVMFADMELVGIPYRLVMGEKNLDEGLVEFKAREDAASTNLPLAGIVDLLKERLRGA